MKKNEVYSLTLAAILLAIVIVVQLLGRSYPDFSRMFVGPIVNAVIILTGYFCLRKYGIIMPLLTPVMAFIVGQLNPALAPFIPFIMIGNLLYVLMFLFKNNTLTDRVISIVIGSVLKFGFLFLSAKYLVPMLKLNIPAKVQTNMLTAFGTVQLIAALIGGAVALVLIELLKKRKVV